MKVNLELSQEIYKLVQYIPSSELNTVLEQLIREAITARTDLTEEGKDLSVEDLLRYIGKNSPVIERANGLESDPVDSEVTTPDLDYSDFNDLGDLAELMK